MSFAPLSVVRWFVVVALTVACSDTALAQFRSQYRQPYGAGPRVQGGYVASIAYSQSTGKVGFSARQATTKEGADALAIRMCGAPDAKVWMWGQNQWVAIAAVAGQVGNAGFGRGNTADEAQQRAMAECAKRAADHKYRVVLCVHSDGRRVADDQLRRVEGKVAVSKTGFFAALAFSPSTGKLGSTSGKARSVDEAKALALKDCGAEDAKVFMWGDQWVAIAVAPSLPGVAGFGPGDTRAAAEKAAMEQCAKFAKGAPCKVELAIFSAEEEPADVAAASATLPVETTPAQAEPAETEPAVTEPADATPPAPPAN
jgi:hypothetical protein